MSVMLPVTSDVPHYAFQTTLDGASYGFEFFWNASAAGWFVSLFDANGDPIVNSVRVTVDVPLFLRYPDERKFPGWLVAQDSTGQHADPGRNDLGTRCLLLYFSEAELISLATAAA